MQKLIILIVMFLTLPVLAGNIKDPKVWHQDVIYFSFAEDMPFKEETEKAIMDQASLIKIPVVRDDNFDGDIRFIYNPSHPYPESTGLQWSGDRTVACPITVNDTFANNPTAFASAAVHGIWGHCICSLGHTTQFVFQDRPKLFSKFSPFMQPLMASGGRIISTDFSYDDKNACWEAYGRKLKNRFKVDIVSDQKFDNIFLINATLKEYSLSKFGNDDVTTFRNVLPGKYKILVRLPGSIESKFLCRTEKGYSICNKPDIIWITKNKRIRIRESN